MASPAWMLKYRKQTGVKKGSLAQTKAVKFVQGNEVEGRRGGSEVMDYQCVSKLFLLLQKQFLIDQRGSLVLKQHILMLVKDIDSYLLSVSLPQLTVLFHPSSLNIFPVLLLSIGVELVPKKLEVGLFLLFYFHADAHIAFRVAEGLQFLVDDCGISDVMHGKLGAALGGASATDDRHFCWGKLADSTGGDGAAVSALAGLDRRQVVHEDKIIDMIERIQGRWISGLY